MPATLSPEILQLIFEQLEITSSVDYKENQRSVRTLQSISWVNKACHRLATTILRHTIDHASGSQTGNPDLGQVLAYLIKHKTSPIRRILLRDILFAPEDDGRSDCEDNRSDHGDCESIIQMDYTSALAELSIPDELRTQMAVGLKKAQYDALVTMIIALSPNLDELELVPASSNFEIGTYLEEYQFENTLLWQLMTQTSSSTSIVSKLTKVSCKPPFSTPSTKAMQPFLSLPALKYLSTSGVSILQSFKPFAHTSNIQSLQLSNGAFADYAIVSILALCPNLQIFELCSKPSFSPSQTIFSHQFDYAAIGAALSLYTQSLRVLRLDNSLASYWSQGGFNNVNSVGRLGKLQKLSSIALSCEALLGDSRDTRSGDLATVLPFSIRRLHIIPSEVKPRGGDADAEKRIQQEISALALNDFPYFEECIIESRGEIIFNCTGWRVKSYDKPVVRVPRSNGFTLHGPKYTMVLDMNLTRSNNLSELDADGITNDSVANQPRPGIFLQETPCSDSALKSNRLVDERDYISYSRRLCILSLPKMATM